MKILIIGGSLFLGAAIVEIILENDMEVFVLNRGSRRLSNTIQLIANRDNTIELNLALNDYEFFDLVIDTCCYNVLQAQILQQSLNNKYGHFVNISSATVYNETELPPFVETQQRNGNSMWGAIMVYRKP